jgi:outer membrane receptor protein involved in Fe transport
MIFQSPRSLTFRFLRSSARRLLLSISWLMLCAFCLPAAYGQSATATLSGTVEDERGALVPGAEVTLINIGTRLERRATTNEQGSFVLTLVPPSNYVVRVESKGFASVEVQSLVLNVGDQKSLQIRLKAGTVTEMVQVEGYASLINESPSVSTVVDRQFVENLPLNGRSFQSLILLTPGVVQTVGGNGDFSVNGNRSNANYYTVDGVSANVGVDTLGIYPAQGQAGTTPDVTASGMTQNLVTIDSLEEFKIQTSTYTAELGRQPGGQIQLITRSGKNDFHGSVFEYLRNEAFEANDWFSNATPLTAAQRAAGLTKQPRVPLRQNLFGGTFSGPVVLPGFGEGGKPFWVGRNRTFFFFSYEGLRLRLPSSLNTLVPSLELRASAHPALRPLLNAAPLPTGPQGADGVAPYFVVNTRTNRHDATQLRIDHNINGRLNIFGRYSRTPSDSITRGLGGITGIRKESQALTFGANTVLTPALSSETRFNYTLSRGRNSITRDTFGGAVPYQMSQLITGYTGDLRVQGAFLFQFSGAGLNIGAGDALDSFNEQYNLVENISWVKGSHAFKFGFDHRRLTPIYGPVPYSQSISVTSANNARAGLVNVTIQRKQETHPIFDNFSAYAQDTWRVTPNLTLDLGLRWEFNPPPGEANGLKPVLITGVDNLLTATLAPPASPLYSPFYKAFAPRFGAAYQLFRKPGRETVIRGGFGVYYDMGNALATAGFGGFPFTATKPTLTNVSIPLTAAQAEPPSFANVTLPSTQSFRALNPDLELPYTLEWNLAVEHSLGANQTVSVSYVASAGRKLLSTRSTNNTRPAFGNTRPNPNFGTISYTFNGPTSDYHSLQTQFRRRLSKGLQALVNYTWAHTIDEVSSEDQSGVLERGNAGFDVRHNFSAAVSYNLPKPELGRILNAVVGGWSLDTIFVARTGAPIDLRGSSSQVLEDGTLIFRRPDYLGGPYWIDDPTAPGGKLLNPAAFAVVPAPNTRQGTLGRNVVHALGLQSVNMALRRKFGLTEKVNLSLTAEAFNVFNHPAFGPPGSVGTNVSVPTNPFANLAWAKSTAMLNRSIGSDLTRQYQAGGPRSMQFTARIAF